MNENHVIKAVLGIVSMLAPASFLISLLLKRVFARDVGVNGWRDIRGLEHRYVFAFSNNEEVPITEPVSLRLRTLLPRVIESPRLLAGPDRPERFELKDGVWQLTAPAMRPLATWIVECHTGGGEGDVEFLVEIGKGVELKTFGCRPTPQRRKLGVSMRVFATLGAIALYLGEKTLPIHETSPLRIDLDQVDVVMLLVIAVAGIVTLFIMRPPTPAPVFGYLTAPRKTD